MTPELAHCVCGSLLVLRVSRSPLPGYSDTITQTCPRCFGAGRRSILWIACVTQDEEAVWE